MGAGELAATRRASKVGCLMVASSEDGEDWRRPGVERIVAAATPPPDQGTVPGAVGAFRRQSLQAVGGVSDDTLAEDTDLTMAINPAVGRPGASGGQEQRHRRSAPMAVRP